MDTANPDPSCEVSLWSTAEIGQIRKGNTSIYPILLAIIGLAVCTVSDDEPALHRASVKLT